MAKIRHIALKTANTRAVADFYIRTFDLVEIWQRPVENGAVYLSDGYINLAILPNAGPDSGGVAEPEGLDHFGFAVDDVQDAAALAMRNGATQGRTEVPRDGRFADSYVRDPIGQRVDLSDTGWATEPADRTPIHASHGSRS
jgi:catechol 2,3-dioxygenase-like lactoylglutathione lyase family enzyme